MIGIYKITSPNNRVYIGQSIDIYRRFNDYRKINSIKKQPKLYNSLIKYGIDNHIFEIIEECAIELLNERERYFQDFYDVISENGLNSLLTKTNDKSGKLSEVHKKNISIGNIGKKRNNNHLKKENFIRSEEMRIKMSNSAKNKKITLEHKNKTIYKLKNMPKESRLKSALTQSYPIIDINTGVFYNNARDLCDIYGFSRSTILYKMRNNLKNNTQFKYA
jgi:group I intron endonuclease